MRASFRVNEHGDVVEVAPEKTQDEVAAEAEADKARWQREMEQRERDLHPGNRL